MLTNCQLQQEGEGGSSLYWRSAIHAQVRLLVQVMMPKFKHFYNFHLEF